MTPSEILQEYETTGSIDFLSELEGEDLWGFLDTNYVFSAPTLYREVVLEARREVAADLDVWMNLARSDLKVKQDWIAGLTDHRMIGSNIPVDTIWEIIEYLKERQVK